MEKVILVAKLRDNLGTGNSRALRKQGYIPAVVYGLGQNNLNVILEEKEVTKLYRKPSFTSRIITIDLEGKHIDVIAKSVQLHITKELVEHADFIYVVNSQDQKVEVPLIFDGKERCNGVKRGGFFNIIHRKVTLICDPKNIPENIVINASRMNVGSTIKASSLQIPEGCKLASKKDFVIASITGKKGKSTGEEDTESEAA